MAVEGLDASSDRAISEPDGLPRAVPSEPTREELLAAVAALQAQLAQQPPLYVREVSGIAPRAPPRLYVGEVGATPPPSHPKKKPSKAATPTAAQFALVRGLLAPGGRTGKDTPEQIVSQITALKAIIVSGVNSAGYGDKRTEFRSLAEMRQILNDLEEALAEALG